MVKASSILEDSSRLHSLRSKTDNQKSARPKLSEISEIDLKHGPASKDNYQRNFPKDVDKRSFEADQAIKPSLRQNEVLGDKRK